MQRSRKQTGDDAPVARAKKPKQVSYVVLQQKLLRIILFLFGRACTDSRSSFLLFLSQNGQKVVRPFCCDTKYMFFFIVVMAIARSLCTHCRRPSCAVDRHCGAWPWMSLTTVTRLRWDSPNCWLYRSRRRRSVATRCGCVS